VVRTVKWALTALDDLEKAASYIEKDSPRYASILVQESFQAAKSLHQWFERGRIVPEIANPNIRELFVMNYRLVYQITPDSIFILGFIHGSRDLQTIWNSEKRS
jgi:toxin ParE1/3/4